MSIIRITKQKNFSIIPNVALNDPNLSFKAKGLLALLLTFPEDTNITLSILTDYCKDSKSSISSGLKELKEAGYIQGGAE